MRHDSEGRLTRSGFCLPCRIRGAANSKAVPVSIKARARLHTILWNRGGRGTAAPTPTMTDGLDRLASANRPGAFALSRPARTKAPHAAETPHGTDPGRRARREPPEAGRQGAVRSLTATTDTHGKILDSGGERR
jgi:hypothetical protein